MNAFRPLLLVVLMCWCSCSSADERVARPNIVLIYADDLGYGDVSCNGTSKVRTPHIDRVAKEGLRLTDAHSSSATCTPSRYALLTGKYPWRVPGTGILPGDAGLIIKPGTATLPEMLQRAGYRTGAVGKWHLGLGKGGPSTDWNRGIAPGAREVGFDYSFLIPATGDRVPCVYVENGSVVSLDPKDPIQVSYGKSAGNDPTGKSRPDLLKMRPSHGHDMTIVNGVSRIGTMSGGHSARWVDEDMADTITEKAVRFIDSSKDRPFFLYFATHDIHVPRLPHPRFAGMSGLGPRGDVILEFDWSVGKILEVLERLGIAENTLLIVTSDNGPVVDDGYQDDAVAKLGDHRPSGPFRGGKYSLFEGGTRVPFLVRWPGKIKPAVSNALVCQVDLFASLASLVGQNLADDAAPDSQDVLKALLGEDIKGRDVLVHHANGLALRQGKWKLIPARKGQAVAASTGIETGAAPRTQLYDLDTDPGETTNLADEQSERAMKMAATLDSQKSSTRTRP